MMSNTAGNTSPWWEPEGTLRSACVEIVILAVVVPEVLGLLRPELADALVPLHVLVPTLFAIRYGFVGGVSAALLLTLVSFQLSYYPPHAIAHFPKFEAAVYLVAAAIVGQFHDHWWRKLRDMRALAAQDRLRLAQFASRLHLLQASHSELERHLGATRTSLRASLQRLKEQLAKSRGNAEQPLAGIGTCLLQILAESCHVHACAVYEIKDRTLSSSRPVATFGGAAELLPTNPLLREALTSGRVVSVRANDDGVEQVIAVVPLVDSLGHIHGVVSITHMSFIAIHQHTFDLMDIIARQAAEILSSHVDLFATVGDRRMLLGRLRHGMSMANFQGMSLAIVTLKIVEPAKSEQLLVRCLEVLRGIDQPWYCRDRHSHPVVVILMPTPGEDAVHAHLDRLRDHVAELHGRRIATEGIQASFTVLQDKQSVEEALSITLRGCDMQVPQARPYLVEVLKERVS